MKKIDRFHLKDILGDGGAASTLYRALEQLPGDNEREVAVKVLPPIPSGDDRAAQRFYNEVKTLAQLSVHPHIVTIYSMGVAEQAKNGGGIPWIALEHSSTTLAQKITEQLAPVDSVIQILHQVGLALAAMHALTPPLLHQALRPANILIDKTNNLKITDFSLASGIGEDQTFSASMVRYAAPEMLSPEYGQINPTTDLYALGHIAYEFALGSRKSREQFPAVYEGNSTKEAQPAKWMAWHCSAKTELAKLSDVRKDFPATLADVISRLMAKDIKSRYATATEFLSALAAARNAAPSASRAIPTAAPTEDLLELAPASTPAPATRSDSRTAPSTASAPIALAPSEPTRSSPRPPIDPSEPQQSIPLTSASAKYWVRLRGNITGPFDVAMLQRMYRQGQLSRLHQVSTDRTTWLSSSSIEGLHGPVAG